MPSTPERDQCGVVHADPEKLPICHRKRGTGVSCIDQHSHIVSDARLHSRRDAALRQAIRDSSQFLANMSPAAQGSHVHPPVQDAFADVDFDSTRLFTGSVRAGLAHDETALLRLLSKEA